METATQERRNGRTREVTSTDDYPNSGLG